ncbi:MAG TPA: hypothetical protein VGO47_04910, partial [Chlamydiales bacterium]|nr:hypothetical protein [Chlamydiales bacterium]
LRMDFKSFFSDTVGTISSINGFDGLTVPWGESGLRSPPKSGTSNSRGSNDPLKRSFGTAMVRERDKEQDCASRGGDSTWERIISGNGDYSRPARSCDEWKCFT